MFSIRLRALAVKKPRNLRPILQHATNTNETKETYCGNMCKHMEHVETYKYETSWNLSMENGNHLYYQSWRQKLLSYLYILCVNMDGWWVGTIHLRWLHLLAGEESSPNTGACRWSSLSWPLGHHSEVVGRSLLQLQPHAHTRVFEKLKPMGHLPMARNQAQSRLPSNLLSFTPPRRRFLPWASPPSGEVSFTPLWPSFMRCSLSFESIVIFKFLRWSYTLPIFLKFLRRKDGKGPLKPVILNHILQRAKHRWSSIFWDRNLRIRSLLRFFATQFFEAWIWGATLVTWTFKDSPKENSCVEKRPQVSMTIKISINNLCLSIKSCSML